MTLFHCGVTVCKRKCLYLPAQQSLHTRLPSYLAWESEGSNGWSKLCSQYNDADAEVALLGVASEDGNDERRERTILHDVVVGELQVRKSVEGGEGEAGRGCDLSCPCSLPLSQLHLLAENNAV